MAGSGVAADRDTLGLQERHASRDCKNRRQPSKETNCRYHFRLFVLVYECNRPPFGNRTHTRLEGNDQNTKQITSSQIPILGYRTLAVARAPTYRLIGQGHPDKPHFSRTSFSYRFDFGSAAFRRQDRPFRKGSELLLKPAEELERASDSSVAAA